MNLLQAYLTTTPEERRSTAAIAILASLDTFSNVSPRVAECVIQELKDQRQHLKMIASENYSSLAVQLTMGNWLTDKYAEGYAHHRFYAGCEQIDEIEDEACRLLKNLFRSEHAYVQPHSGCDANLIAFWTILTHKIQSKELERLKKKSVDELNAGEFEQLRQLLVNQKLMGLSLNSGGHLTHGYRHNISSKLFRAVFYDVDPETGLLNYDKIAEIAVQERPTILLAGYSAYPRKIDFAKMRQIAEDVGAVFMVDMAHFAGLVAGGVFTGVYDPVPHADVTTSTTHKTLRGPRGGIILCKHEFAHILDKGCPMVQGGPLPHVLAAKAVAFTEASAPSFSAYAHRIVENSQTLADELMKNGLTVLTGGTDNHLVLLDVSPLGLTGKQAEHALRQCLITCNRNSIPFDKNGPWYTSGVRLGTPALTTLGMGKEEMKQIAQAIVLCLRNAQGMLNEAGGINRAIAKLPQHIEETVRQTVRELLQAFPLYPEIII